MPATSPAPTASLSPAPLSEVIDPGWAAALSPVEPTIRELGRMLREEGRLGHGYLPAGSDVLRAFNYPLARVKVLIVGQDPYPTPGHAMGLSFSVSPGTPLPASLRNIYQELESDLGIPPAPTGDLRAWAEQGVCLLNRVLTVRPGTPGSHRGRGWEEVTECAISALVERGGPLVAVLWGRDAQNLRPLFGDTPTVCSPHPSPLSAYRGFFGSRPFSRVNQLLAEQGAAGVDWQVSPGSSRGAGMLA